MMFLRQLLLVLLLILSFSGLSFGATLFDRSLAQLQSRSLQVPADDFTFIVMGDSRDDDAQFRRALKLAQSYDPLFILHGGDFSARGGEKETAAFLSLVRETAPEIPIFVVIGNHENRRIFEREVGPGHFTLSSKRLGFTLVAVDNAGYKLQRGELDYLASELRSANRSRFVAMHIPPKTERWNWHAFSDGAEELKEILFKNGVLGVFFSHVHLFDRTEFGGVPAFITGGAGAPLTTFGYVGEPVYHFVLVRVKDGKATFTKITVPERR